MLIELLSNYGLFLLKTITVVISILLILNFIINSKKNKNKGNLVIENINSELLSLEENDYREHGLLDLLYQYKMNAAELNFKIWGDFVSKLTHWPIGGAPEEWESLPFELHVTSKPKKV